MALSRKNSKHKRSISYSGGILSSFLSHNTGSSSSGSNVPETKTDKVNSKMANSSRNVHRTSSNAPNIAATEGKSAKPISPLANNTDNALFSFTSTSTQEITDTLQIIEKGLCFS